MNKIKLIFILAFLLAGFVFLAHYWVVGSGVWGDGQYYYSYVRSLVVDGNLDLSNEIKHFSLSEMRTNIGPGIVWLPVFALVHFLVRGDGYGHIYQITIGLFSVFSALVGLYVCFLVTKKYYPLKIALTACLSIWLASNLFFYTAVDPINTHAVSFLFASLAVYFLDWEKFGTLGIMAAILGIIRNSDLIIVLPIIILIKKLKKQIAFLSGLLIAFLPQLIIWKLIFGKVSSPYFIFGGSFNWLKPKITDVLFSANNGLFFYSPILIFSILGFYYLRIKSRILANIGIIWLVLQTYITASWFLWWMGAAYGGRVFISLMPFFILGLAALIDRFKKRIIFIYPVLAIFVILNMISIIKYLIYLQ